MTRDSGNLSIDFIVGFTIFLIAFIWVVSMIPGLLIGLQSYTIDSDAVAYRTGVILAEDPGEPTLPSFPWETLSNIDVVRFGLAVSKNTPLILSRNKVDKFFCSSVFSYPDDYQQRIIFGDYPYKFNISLIEVESNKTPLFVGDVMSGNYGTIRRLVKIKEPSNATINAGNLTYMTAHPYYYNGENETQHEFSILINNTELIRDKVRDPVYQIDPAREKITIHITDLNSTLYSGREKCFNINLTKIYAKDPAFVRIQLFSEPVIDGVQYHDITTEGLYTTLPSIKNNISLILDPNFIPWSNYPQVYLNLTFNLVKNTSAGCDPAITGSRFLNNSLASAFDYNYNNDSVTQPNLRDAVLEVRTGSGYRTVTGPLPVNLNAMFKYEILSGFSTYTVKFTDQSTGSPVDWEWDFTNDGSVDSTLNNPTNSYGAPGIKTVKLTVKDASGLTSSTTGTVDLSAPVAGFTANTTLGSVPLVVQFTDTSTGGAPSSWDWNFGDGSPHSYNVTTIAHTYTVANTYTAQLTVSNIFGNNSTTKQVTVIPPAPVASFNTAPSPASGNAPLAVTFTDTTSGGTPTIWDWNFGDGSPHSYNMTTIAHTYNVAGSYTAQLTVSNAGGSSSASAPVSVGIAATPVAAFSGTPVWGLAPLNVQFNDASTGVPTSWKWEYKNVAVPWTQFSTAQNPVFSFQTGTYDIRLTATNAGGSNTLTKTGYIKAYSVRSSNTAPFGGSWTVPANVTSVDYCVVAGGGGGGRYGGGGGAGGFLTGTLTVTPTNSLTATIGGGGAGSTSSNNKGTNGGNSVFGPTITATGGGGGGSTNNAAGADGGSGGGGVRLGNAGGAGSQGSAGGAGSTNGGTNYLGGGGGGAGGIGSDGSGAAAGNGGPGSTCSINGITYAGGGGGGSYAAGTAGTATNGGGAGGDGANGSNAQANTGGGGGGGGYSGGNYDGGGGGSGIVIIRYY